MIIPNKTFSDTAKALVALLTQNFLKRTHTGYILIHDEQNNGKVIQIPENQSKYNDSAHAHAITKGHKTMPLKHFYASGSTLANETLTEIGETLGKDGINLILQNTPLEDVKPALGVGSNMYPIYRTGNTLLIGYNKL